MATSFLKRERWGTAEPALSSYERGMPASARCKQPRARRNNDRNQLVPIIAGRSALSTVDSISLGRRSFAGTPAIRSRERIQRSPRLPRRDRLNGTRHRRWRSPVGAPATMKPRAQCGVSLVYTDWVARGEQVAERLVRVQSQRAGGRADPSGRLFGRSQAHAERCMAAGGPGADAVGAGGAAAAPRRERGTPGDRLGFWRGDFQ